MPRLSHDDLARFLDVDVDVDADAAVAAGAGLKRDRNRARAVPHPANRTTRRPAVRANGAADADIGGAGHGSPRHRPHARPHERNPFRCGRCRRMVEPPPSGGRHRNHCPFCLTSRHVDRRRPGDRECDCRALMAPVGTAFRPDGEQLVVHRCNGCGAVRRCRVAADDDAAMLLRLPPFALSAAPEEDAAEEAIA